MSDHSKPTTVTATVVNGELRLDEALPYANECRVAVTIQPVEAPLQEREGEDEKFESLLQLIQQRPIHSGARHFTREELHERD